MEGNPRDPGRPPGPRPDRRPGAPARRRRHPRQPGLDRDPSPAKLACRHGCSGILGLGDFGLWPDRRIARSTGAVDGNHDAHPLAAEAYPAGADGIAPIRDGLLDWATRGARWTWCTLGFGALGRGLLHRPGHPHVGAELVGDRDHHRCGRGAPGGRAPRRAGLPRRARGCVDLGHRRLPGIRGHEQGQRAEPEEQVPGRSRQAGDAPQAVGPRPLPPPLSPGDEEPSHHGRGPGVGRGGQRGSWGVLELPSLTLTDGSAIQAAKMRAIANGAA